MSAPASVSSCASCGAAQPGRFCAACGEKRVGPHDFTIAHFFEDAFEHLTHLDFRSLRAFRTLLFRPGQLTRDYMEGRRKRSGVGPIKLFIIVNIVFALLIGFTGWVPLNTPLHVQVTNWPLMELKRDMSEAALVRKGVSREEFTREFDRVAKTESKEWVFSMIPAFAAVLALSYGFRRFFYEHLVFATHFYAVVLIAILAFTFFFDYILRPIVIATHGSVNGENLSLIVIEGGLLIYLFLALRRAYGSGAIAAGLRSLLLTVAMMAILQGYRLLLFFVTLWALHEA